MKNIYIITIIFILFTQAVSSYIYAGEDYNLTTIKCYGDVKIELGSEFNITPEEYNFIGCNNYDEDKWSCNCKDGEEQLIQIYTKKGTNNKYNVKLSYYVQPKLKVPEYDVTVELPPREQVQNELNYMTRTFPGLQVGKAPPKPLPPVTPFVWTYFIFGGVMLLAIIIFGGIFLFRYIMRDEDDRKPIGSREPQQTTTVQKSPGQMTDKEILEYFRNNSK